MEIFLSHTMIPSTNYTNTNTDTDNNNNNNTKQTDKLTRQLSTLDWIGFSIGSMHMDNDQQL